MKLSVDQEAAVQEAMMFLMDDNPDNSEMSISGPAGTGKTVLTKHLLADARKQGKMIKLLSGGDSNEFPVYLTSTTNKAARVLSMACNEKAGTIHSLLGLRVENNYKTGKTTLRRSSSSKVIRNSLIIVDEGSMANEELLKTIREATINCKVIYVGDSYQLAPVFENSCPVFSKVKNQVQLTTIQRQAAGSSIIQFASGFRNALDTGIFPRAETYGIDVQLLDGPQFREMAHKHFGNMKVVDHARMVAWTNSRVHQYNDYLRKLNTTNPDYEVGEFLLTNQPVLGANKQVILSTDAIAQITHIHNGEEDGIEGWDITLNNEIVVFQAKKQYEVIARIKAYARAKDWVEYFRAKEQFADLRPIYACTVNKAQGSTYKYVFIDLDDIRRNNKNSEIARLMYTAITRASDKVYMYGSLPDRLYA